MRCRRVRGGAGRLKAVAMIFQTHFQLYKTNFKWNKDILMKERALFRKAESYVSHHPTKINERN